MSETMIREFLYLDWERVRSMASQAMHGVPETSSRTDDHTAVISGDTRAGLASILSAQLGGELQSHDAVSETSSFHHHVYSLFEAALLECDSVLDVTNSSRGEAVSWTEENLWDGRLILLSGSMRFMNYRQIASQVEGLPRLAKLIGDFSALGLKQKLAEGEIDKNAFDASTRDQQQMLKDLKQMNSGGLAEFVRDYFSGAVRVRIRPDCVSSDAAVAVATCDEESFMDSSAIFAHRHGFNSGSDWRALCIVNMSDESLRGGASLPTGNAIDDGLEGVAVGIEGMFSVMSSCTFPAVSVTPLAIYRECVIGQ